MRRFFVVAAAYVGVLVVASALVSRSQPEPRAAAPAPGDDLQLLSSLQPFGDCDELLGYFRTEALQRVGPWGLDGGVAVLEADAAEGATSADIATGGGDAGARTAQEGGADYSATNVQEAGVDEPDIVKTDGSRVVALAGGRLHVLQVLADQTLRRAGSLRIPDVWGAGLLLDGERVLLLSYGSDEVRPLDDAGSAERDLEIMPGYGAPVSRLLLIDISDPSRPAITSSLRVDGQYSSARLVDGVARVVVSSQPVALPFVTPRGGGLRAEREATRRNREVVAASTIDDWLPYAVATDEVTGEQTERPLLDCDRVHHPTEFAGFGLASVVTVDLAGDLRARGSAAVVGSAETVYASADNLYVALTEWGEEAHREGRLRAPDSVTTSLHQFDIRDPADARYVASGSVQGRLLNQWALSEHDGHLRVATTTDRVGRGGDRSDSAVSVLRAAGQRLRRVGHVDGLGRGEQIYAVRYAGDIGYVVTFRQIDPLYTLDLSEPTRPRLLGELKIPGYSAYLHPVADGRLVGVGQDARANGQVTGSQVSLFDVTDLERPRRVDQVNLGAGSSPVEYDHRAFLYWAPTDTVVIPLERWGRRRPFLGVVVLGLAGDRLEMRGQISHADGGKDPHVAYDHGAMVTRIIVLGDALVTMSDSGIAVHGQADLQPRQWVPFRP